MDLGLAVKVDQIGFPNCLDVEWEEREMSRISRFLA